MELHPGWTAKDNYAINGKRKKKKRERNADGGETGLFKQNVYIHLFHSDHL